MKFKVRAYKTETRSTFLQTFVGNDQGQGFRIQFRRNGLHQTVKERLKSNPNLGRLNYVQKKLSRSRGLLKLSLQMIRLDDLE